jgi:hypothetical protein
MKDKQEIKNEFETWLDTQDEATKNLVQERFSVLERTISNTRDERDTLSRELKGLARKVDSDSDAGIAIGELRNRLAASEKKSSFIELAVQKGIKRPSAAYAIATSENAFLEDGTPDFEKIRETIPELFSTVNTNTSAGSGTGTAGKPLTAKQQANEALRADPKK